MTHADSLDKSAEKQRLQEKKRERKRKQKLSQQDEISSPPVLLPAESNQNDYLSDNSNYSEVGHGSLIKRPRTSNEEDDQIKDKITKNVVASADQKTLEEMALALLQR